MNVSFPIALFWVGLLALIIGYLLRKRKSGQIFKMISATAFFIGGLLFAWWAVLRMINFR